MPLLPSDPVKRARLGLAALRGKWVLVTFDAAAAPRPELLAAIEGRHLSRTSPGEFPGERGDPNSGVG